MSDRELTTEHNLIKCSMGRCCNAKLVDDLEKQNKELKAILKDLLTTSVDSRTWVYEMSATIDAVINEEK